MTGNADFAVATASAADEIAEEQTALANFAPVITNMNVVFQVRHAQDSAD